jgi:octaprenyl-diphosphate synthase
LLASACAAGAWSTTNDPVKTELLRSFGEKVGIAFQIKDDLFDYGTDNVGKPTGNDIKEKKLTLPLIFTLNKASAADKRKMIYVIKNENRDKEKVSWLIEMVTEAGGISYAVEKMNEYRNDALNILKNLPQNDANLALEELVRYTTDRKY